MWDGLFHMSTYIFTALGLYTLWRYSRKRHIRWSGKLLPGAMLVGFGVFNLVEGLIDHHLLGIHHVNETVLRDQWIYWDIAFLVWGFTMLVGGWLLLKQGQARRRRAASRNQPALPENKSSSLAHPTPNELRQAKRPDERGRHD